MAKEPYSAAVQANKVKLTSLRDALIKSKLNFMPKGRHGLKASIYPLVAAAYPEFCDNDPSLNLRYASKGQKAAHPEWHEIVRKTLDELGSAIAAKVNPTKRDGLWEIHSETDGDEDAIEEAIRRDGSIGETERAQLIASRRGQGRFRQAISSRQCHVTGVNDERFLRASHIKPWAKSSNEERLDGENGLLLAPHVDVLFDRGFITFNTEGKLIASQSLPLEVIEKLRLDLSNVPTLPLVGRRREYMLYHSQNRFK